MGSWWRALAAATLLSSFFATSAASDPTASAHPASPASRRAALRPTQLTPAPAYTTLHSPIPPRSTPCPGKKGSQPKAQVVEPLVGLVGEELRVGAEGVGDPAVAAREDDKGRLGRGGVGVAELVDAGDDGGEGGADVPVAAADEGARLAVAEGGDEGGGGDVGGGEEPEGVGDYGLLAREPLAELLHDGLVGEAGGLGKGVRGGAGAVEAGAAGAGLGRLRHPPCRLLHGRVLRVSRPRHAF